jgi:D-alanyl-D-alanine carboxypeptidase (penicillin-binding protein 5/6)
MPGASFLLADMNTGQILVAKAPHARHLPASTLKTLTALTLIPLLNPNAKLVVKPRDVAVDGTRLGILPGTSYRIGMLFQGLLMVSGNDAAFALARGNHSVAATLKAMNATAAHLNAFDTVAKDPSGLDKAGQRTSAYDLALIGRAAMKLPDFRRYVRTKVASMPGGWAGGKLKPGFKINSHNKLLFNYPGTIGIKTGYTNAAKATFIGAATRGGKTYLITQMSSPNGSWRPSAALLNWAFAHGRSVTPIGKLVEPGVPAKPKPAALPTSPKKTISLGASAGQPALPAWLGVAGGISLLALLGGGLTRRNTGRNRSKHRSR